MRILVVDDEVHVLRSLARALRFKGAEVLTAADAREALELLGEHEVQAVVTDHFLPPGPTGVWLLENVMHQYPHVRRVLFSGKPVPHAKELVKIGVVHGFLRKPVTASEVLRSASEPAEAQTADS